MSTAQHVQTAFSLEEETILLRLVIGAAGVQRRSKTLSREAADTHNADPDSVRGEVIKLPEEAMEPITKVISASRTAFYFHTLPWDDNAYRMCPLARYAAVKSILATKRNEFTDQVEALVGDRDRWATDYVRRVGRVLAEELPFPTKTELRGYFRFELREMPLRDPDNKDFRLRHINRKDFEELRASMGSQMKDRVQEAEGEIVRRLAKVVGAIVTASEDKEKPRYHSSLATNLTSVLDVLPTLNITNDPGIARVIERARKELGGLDVDTLKKDEATRKATHKAASSVLDDIKRLG